MHLAVLEASKRPEPGDCPQVPSADESKWHVLTPETGLALAFFDGATTLDAISRQLQEVANFTELAARQLLTRTVGAFFTGSDPVLCDAQTLVPGSWPVYPPEDMVVPPSCFEPDKRLDAPLSLVLMPFNQCRTDCLYCYSERNPIPPRDLLSLKRWTEILREGAAAGTNIAVFSGGDPMLYPNILQLLDVLISLDYAFLVSTKSLVKASFAKALAAAGIGDRFFQISLDAWNPNLADFMAGRLGYHRTALRSIENLVTAGIRYASTQYVRPTITRIYRPFSKGLVSLGLLRQLRQPTDGPCTGMTMETSWLLGRWTGCETRSRRSTMVMRILRPDSTAQ